MMHVMTYSEIKHEVIVNMPYILTSFLIKKKVYTIFVNTLVEEINDVGHNLQSFWLKTLKTMYTPSEWLKFPIAKGNQEIRTLYIPFEIYFANYVNNIISQKVINRTKCRVNYKQISSLRHFLIAEMMPYRLIHFLIENKVFKEYINLFIEADPYELNDEDYYQLQSNNAIYYVTYCHFNDDSKWIDLDYKYRKYYNSL